MSDSIISVQNVSKSYLLGHEGPKERYTALRDVIARNAKSILRSTGDLFKGQQVVGGDEVEEFWALKDVSFEVKRGEVLGIIGRNGAGKSTLLKILSRITEPTKGRIELNGRVSSLLEVGTGFHPELTGRENIFLNGAILGMTRAEIKRKFDEIVAFAEVEKFLDTPVKRYSSGMYVRLAFAVAAHLEPEILIVDEVLAVGDAEFQKKCLGKMKDVATEGRTVLFVSHNLIAVQRLCTEGILIAEGKILKTGKIAECISQYIGDYPDADAEKGSVELEELGQTNNQGFKFTKISIIRQNNIVSNSILAGEKFHIEVKFKIFKKHRDLVVGFAVRTHDGTPLFATHNNDYGKNYSLESGSYCVQMQFSPNYLRPGRYTISLGAISSGELIAHHSSAISLHVEQALSDYLTYSDDRIGSVFIPMKWGEPEII